jgi:hypothetical protein
MDGRGKANGRRKAQAKFESIWFRNAFSVTELLHWATRLSSQIGLIASSVAMAHQLFVKLSTPLPKLLFEATLGIVLVIQPSTLGTCTL